MSQYQLRVDGHKYAVSVAIPLGDNRTAADAHRIAEAMLTAADEAWDRAHQPPLEPDPRVVTPDDVREPT